MIFRARFCSSWAGWRFALAGGLLLLVGVPLSMPFLELLDQREGFLAWEEWGRLSALAGNTMCLVGGTLILSIPLGVSGALLLYRTDLPLRHVFRSLLVLVLFVPLPLWGAAWYGVFFLADWIPATGPWWQRLGFAIGLQTLAALPWVVLMTGHGLSWVERELEEDALLHAGPTRVVWTVTLARSKAIIMTAALWVVLQSAGEITLTDKMEIRTFGEEVYFQFQTGAGFVRAVAVAMPGVFLVAALLLWSGWRLKEKLPPLVSLLEPPLLFSLGKARIPVAAGMLLLGGALFGVPLFSLVHEVGLAGTPETWSAQTAWSHLEHVLHLRARLVLDSFLLAVLAGALAAVTGLVACRLAQGIRWFAAFLLILMAVAWSLPGPVIGIGLKDLIGFLVLQTDSQPLALALYDGPSLLPVFWIYLIRFFPCALAILWPVVRLVPRELREAAHLEGADPAQELRRITLPLTLPACFQAAVAVSALSIGELSASKLAATPGSQTFAQEIFMMMHYGLTQDLAALCLLLIGCLVLAGCMGILGSLVFGSLALRDNRAARTKHQASNHI